MRTYSLCALGMLFVLTGCTVGPFYTPPDNIAYDFTVKTARNGIAFSNKTDPDPEWWQNFGDEVLNTLMARAIAQSPSVQQALLRVVQVRENVRLSTAERSPQVDFNTSYLRQQRGLEGQFKSNDAYDKIDQLSDQINEEGQSSDAGRKALDDLSAPSNIFQYGFDSSWELDVFGGVRRSIEQANANLQAEHAQLEDALIILESDVAQRYVDLRSAQASYQIQIQSIEAAHAAWVITQQRAASGLTTQLDVNQARSQYVALQRDLPSYEKRSLQAMSALDMLTGQPPGTLTVLLNTPKPLPRVPDVVGVGVSTSLARRRPDIRKAEAMLHAATAAEGVAVARFYPDISLTGSVGLRASESNYLTKWSSLFYSIGPSLYIPVFEGGRLRANLKIAQAQGVEAGVHYKSTVLNALREIQDSLIAYRTDQEQLLKQEEALTSAEDTLALANDQYVSGLASYLQVLDAQRTVFAARQTGIALNASIISDILFLYRALGGGWESTLGGSSLAEAPQLNHKNEDAVK